MFVCDFKYFTTCFDSGPDLILVPTRKFVNRQTLRRTEMKDE